MMQQLRPLVSSSLSNMTRHIVIVGGGIIGSTTAYYSSLHKQKADTKITLLESTSIAAGASGKAGFVAANYFV